MALVMEVLQTAVVFATVLSLFGVLLRARHWHAGRSDGLAASTPVPDTDAVPPKCRSGAWAALRNGAQRSQQAHGRNQAGRDHRHRQRQVESAVAEHGEAEVDEERRDAQHRADHRKATSPAGLQQHVAVAEQYHADGQQVEDQKALHATGQQEHLPLTPERGVDLMKDQSEQGGEVASFHGPGDAEGCGSCSEHSVAALTACLSDR